ncbi:MAG: tRNA anti-like [Bacteroidota bacterium]|jgi:hypothetical protein
MKKIILYAFGFLAVFSSVYFGGMYLLDDGYDENSKPDYTISASEICNAYSINAIAAKEKYENKLIHLENVQVQEISESLTGVPQVIIPGGRIYFTKGSSVRDLEPGDYITCNAILSVINDYDCQFEPCYNLEK